jgi:hypothetical protein
MFLGGWSGEVPRGQWVLGTAWEPFPGFAPVEKKLCGGKSDPHGAGDSGNTNIMEKRERRERRDRPLKKL